MAIIVDNLAQSATATTVLNIVTDGLHVEVLQKGLLRYLIHGPAIVCYLNLIKDLLIAGSNYEMTALETGVAAAKRVARQVKEMEELQKRR